MKEALPAFAPGGKAQPWDQTYGPYCAAYPIIRFKMNPTRASRLASLVAIACLVVFVTSWSSPPQENKNIVDSAQVLPPVWSPENTDGTYSNPVIYADYSDPDVIRVGDNFYLTSSSFSHFPGLPILQSRDLVNWRIIGHAVSRYPDPAFDHPQHGNGVWAPSIRYHNGEYFIYFGDPDKGIYRTKAKDPGGPWSPLLLVREAKGWIDPCPFWDDDGTAYLVHAWAKSRSGINSILTLHRMNSEGARVLDEGKTIFDGTKNQPTIEGPKIYKRDGYYYIFAPAGGVKPGWQTVLRSRAIDGPYDARVVLEQGSTRVNGPHQGAWVETTSRESWFIHFQDRNAYGRIVHLEPLRWIDGWPVIGEDFDKNGVGEPVERYRKPGVGVQCAVNVPATTDEFSSDTLGLQWQWESNPNTGWYSLHERRGWLRLYPQYLPDTSNLWETGNILGQKIPAREFTCETMLDCSALAEGGDAGLVVLGVDYSYIAVRTTRAGLRIVQVVCKDADRAKMEREIGNVRTNRNKIVLRLTMRDEGLCSFAFSLDGRSFQPLGSESQAKAGKWVGAKIGLFAVQTKSGEPNGSADFDWIRFRGVSKPD